MSRPLQVINGLSIGTKHGIGLWLTPRHLSRSLAPQARSACSAARLSVCCGRELPTRRPAHRRLGSLHPTSLLAFRRERACVGCAAAGGHAGRCAAAFATRVGASAFRWQCNGFDKMQNATSFAEVTIQTAVRRFPDHLRTCTAHVTCAPSLPRWHAYVSA